jgi:GTP-binding protein
VTTHLRSIAIIAHVDHGKTTLVDRMFEQAGLAPAHREKVDRAMDSDAQERERGITISAKVTSIPFDDMLLQIVDTPGHADFGGEVERALHMVDGVLLLVDAAEGPLPQTRFVLRKALALGRPAVVALNKLDRHDARAAQVLDEIYALFIDLGAEEHELDFPVIYLIGREGKAGTRIDQMAPDLRPLLEALRRHIPPPVDQGDAPFRMLVNMVGFDDYVGRLLIGRVESGSLAVGDRVVVVGAKTTREGRVVGLSRQQGVKRTIIARAACGELVSIAGLDASIGDSLCAPERPEPLPRFFVDEPTVVVNFRVNDGPFSGQSGSFVTSRQLRERLYKEAYANVSIRVHDTDSADTFRVFGRGELQLAVLIENLRRQSYELCVGTPEVVTREEGGQVLEPLERLVIDVPLEHVGIVNECVGARRGTMANHHQEGDRVRLEFTIPTRGTFGLRSRLLTATRGTAVQHSVLEGWTPWTGPLERRTNGALVSDRTGTTTPYALFHLQPRGILFIRPGTEVYKGMIIGEHNRDNDLMVNVCREKKLTNVRAAGKDENTVVSPPRKMSLEACMEWIREDELTEVTPDAIRLRKR